MQELLVVDLEATCWEGGAHRPLEMETIEIGAVRLDPSRPDAAREFQCFVRPLRHPVLSDFCTRLTTIRQADVDAAEPFAQAFARFVAWLGEPRAVLFASWGEYDRLQLVRDCAAQRVAYPFHGHWNLKRYVARRLGRKASGMETVLAALGLALEGTHHRGIDDARNLVRLLRRVAGAELAHLLAPGHALPGRLVEDGGPHRLARFVRLALGRRAADFGLAPDAQGFVALAELAAVVERHALPKATRTDLLRLLADPCGRRFELAAEGVRLRPASPPGAPRA